MFYKKLTGTPEYKKEKKVTPVKLTIQVFLILLNVFWMTNTYRLIQIDIAMQGLQWEPWTPLGLEVPTNVYDGFNPPGLKKQYRQFARLYHPDKVAADIEPEVAKKKWEEIQRANDCLSDRSKFDNWLRYGNPEGSVMSRSMDIALPSFLKDENNQLYVLLAFFASIILVPIVILLKLKDTNSPSDVLFDNGIQKKSSALMLMTLMGEVMDKNVKKKVKVITDDQWVEIMESSAEVAKINDDLNKKNNFRDMIRNIIKKLPISDKFDEAVRQIDDIVPRLTTVLVATFAEVKFVKALAAFNAEKDCKVQYTPAMLFDQVIKFTDKVIQNKANGYKGYTFDIKQAELSADDKKELTKDENPDFKKITLRTEISIKHLDLKSIKETETEEIYENYWKSLGLFVCFTNDKSNLSQIFKIDQKKDLVEKTDEEIKSTIDLNVKEEGKYNFKVIFADNFGFSKEVSLTLDAKY